jgi:hypothetical protein
LSVAVVDDNAVGIHLVLECLQDLLDVVAENVLQVVGRYVGDGWAWQSSSVFSSSTTTSGSGITTPTPTQSGMVSNCNKFVLLSPGDTCDIIAFFNGPISTGDYIRWNSGVGSDCKNLQAGTYACVGVTG